MKSVKPNNSLSFVILSFKLWGPVGILMLFLGIPMGVLLSIFIERQLVAAKEIYTKLNGAKQNDAVQDLVISGSPFTMPMA